MAGSQFGQRRGAAGILDVAVAALAGGSVAFATFAMPDGLFTDIVAASRLGDLLPAARPPLGDTARWSAVAAAGLATFVFVWSLLRAIDRYPARRQPASGAGRVDAELSSEPPRVRRADAHPDAPTRRPLRAGRELGEPSEEDEPTVEDTLELVDPAPDEPFADLPVQPLPGFLVPQAPEDAQAAAVPSETEADSLGRLSAQLPDADGDGNASSIGDLMQRLESGLSRREPPAAEAPAAPVAVEPPPAAMPAASVPAEAPAAAAVPAPVVDEAPTAAVPSKPSRTPLDLAPAATPAPEEPPPAEDRVGHRLRSAINDLQRLSGNG